MNASSNRTGSSLSSAVAAATACEVPCSPPPTATVGCREAQGSAAAPASTADPCASSSPSYGRGVGLVGTYAYFIYKGTCTQKVSRLSCKGVRKLDQIFESLHTHMIFIQTTNPTGAYWHTTRNSLIKYWLTKNIVTNSMDWRKLIVQ